jgi:hypothetical protein
MADVFNYTRSPKPKGVFSSEDSILTFSDQSGGDPRSALGLLVQSWNLNYQQQVVEIFELGSSNLYWVKGRPQGNGTFGRVVGPAVNGQGTSKLLPEDAYDICAGGAAVSLTVGSKLCNVQNDQAGRADVTAGFTIKVDGLVVTALGFTASVQDTRIQESINFRFTFLDVVDGEETVA